MVATEPDCTAQSSTGYGTPSICTKTTPSTSGSSSVAGLCRRASFAAYASSLPAVSTNESTRETSAITQAAMKADQKVSSISGTSRSETYRINAWPKRPDSTTAIQPIRAETATSTGRISRPATAAMAVAANHDQMDGADRSGSTRAVTSSVRAQITQTTTSRTTSPIRNFQDILVMAFLPGSSPRWRSPRG